MEIEEVLQVEKNLATENAQEEEEAGSLSKEDSEEASRGCPLLFGFMRNKKTKFRTAIRLPPVRDLEMLLDHDALLCSIMQWTPPSTIVCLPLLLLLLLLLLRGERRRHLGMHLPLLQDWGSTPGSAPR